MKPIKYYIINLLLLALVAITSCNTDNDLLTEADINIGKGCYTCTMVLEGEIDGFEGATTRATGGWGDGDTIYLMFNEVEGVAVFNAADGNWKLEYHAQIPNTTASTCSAYYFENASSLTDKTVSLSPTSVVYGTTSAIYSKEGNVMRVRATLSPLTGRIRFKGTPGDKFTLLGFDYYYTYIKAKATLSNTAIRAEVTIGGDGYSPYYYGSLVNSNKIKVMRDDGEFIISCGNSILATAKTGYMNVPNSNSYNGWEKATHEYVDLGLPSGTLWATMNIDAKNSFSQGYYLGWGEIGPNARYGETNQATYKWYNEGKYNDIIKYNTKATYGEVDNKTVLDPEDDAATVNWGNKWRIPTKEEWDELLNPFNTTSTPQRIFVTTRGMSVSVLLITSELNGNSIYIPCGDYWSSTLNSNTPSRAYCLGLDPYAYLYPDTYELEWNTFDRSRGCYVRPVRNK